jgi:hypothetical protein
MDRVQRRNTVDMTISIRLLRDEQFDEQAWFFGRIGVVRPLAFSGCDLTHQKAASGAAGSTAPHNRGSTATCDKRVGADGIGSTDQRRMQTIQAAGLIQCRAIGRIRQKSHASDIGARQLACAVRIGTRKRNAIFCVARIGAGVAPRNCSIPVQRRRITARALASDGGNRGRPHFDQHKPARVRA